jgi:DNA-directed RNA polymerase beta subunit
MEARLRNLAYAAPIALEMTPVIDGREQDTELVYIGNIPVMLKSKLCFLSQLSKKNLSLQEKTQMTQEDTLSLTALNALSSPWKTCTKPRNR